MTGLFLYTEIINHGKENAMNNSTPEYTFDRSNPSFPEGIRYKTVSRCEEDGYRFSLGASIIKFKNLWVAAYLQSAVKENDERSRFVCKYSCDGCETWSSTQAIADADTEYGRSHGVLYSDGETLYAFCPRAKFNGTDKFKEHDFAMEAYVFSPDTKAWELRGIVSTDGFWPLCEPIKLNNGDLLIAGLECKGTHQPAVAISRGGDCTHFDMVVIPNPDAIPTWGETTVLAYEKELVALVRSHRTEGVVLISRSRDFGQSWSPLAHTEIQAVDSKLYAGQLRDGRRYLIRNIGTSETPPSDRSRKTMTIALETEEGSLRFGDPYLIRHGFDEPARYFRSQWAYPYAVEEDGNLYVVYTKHKENTELAIIPIRALE